MGEQLNGDIIAQLPHLRALAMMLARDRTLANDLVQDTVLRSLRHADQFRPGTNFKAWISTILRNSFFNEMRSRGRTSTPDIDTLRDKIAVNGGQEDHLHMSDFWKAFRTLPAEQREAVTLVGASGFTYQEAASIAKCPAGTMKSRVSRARSQLRQMLNDDLPPITAKTYGRRSASEHRQIHAAPS
jgi:RNA polymerase sigma-70 factor (ECF subfamily)